MVSFDVNVVKGPSLPLSSGPTLNLSWCVKGRGLGGSTPGTFSGKYFSRIVNLQRKHPSRPRSIQISTYISHLQKCR